MKNIILTMRNTLIVNSDIKTKQGLQRFFKETIKCHGVKSAIVGKIGKQYYKQIENEPKQNIYELSEQLFKSGYCEEAWIAAEWVYNKRDVFIKSDIKFFESWINKYIDDWAKCDTFCNHSVGALIEKYPELIKRLYTWAKSNNIWLKRAAAVSLIVPAKQGKFLKEAIKIADILLLDQHDMVQKGYGWLLKEESRKHQKEIFDYVCKNKEIMPRTSLRYAIELMPDKLRKIAMAKK